MSLELIKLKLDKNAVAQNSLLLRKCEQVLSKGVWQRLLIAVEAVGNLGTYRLGISSWHRSWKRSAVYQNASPELGSICYQAILCVIVQAKRGGIEYNHRNTRFNILTDPSFSLWVVVNHQNSWRLCQSGLSGQTSTISPIREAW